MVFMLDTNTCLALIKRKSAKIINHFRLVRWGISVFRLSPSPSSGMESRKATPWKKNRQAFEEFLLPLETADFDDEAAASYGSVSAALEAAGTPIGSLDALIGAHALSLGAVLVTNNTKELKRIKGLKLADWTA